MIIMSLDFVQMILDGHCTVQFAHNDEDDHYRHYNAFDQQLLGFLKGANEMNQADNSLQMRELKTLVIHSLAAVHWLMRIQKGIAQYSHS